MRMCFLPAILAMMFLAVSCNEKESEGVWDNPNFIRLTSTPEKVISGDDKMEIKWSEKAVLKIFDNAGYCADLSNISAQDTIFTSKAWKSDAVPAYAAYSSTDDVQCLPDGIFTIAVPSQQKATTANHIENFTAVAKVEGEHRTAYKASPLKLVNGYVAVKVAFPLVTSITVETVGNEPLAGRVEVDCNTLGMVVTSENDGQVTLTPAVDGTALKVGTHYIAVLPQTYSRGLKVTVSYKQGTPVSKIFFENGVEVPRSTVVALGGEDAIDADIPGEIRIDLNFGKNQWPFVESVLSAEDQAKSETGVYVGDMYTYEWNYEFEETTVTRHLEFFMRGNNAAYKFTDVLNPGSKNSRITLPAMPGRYLRAVKLVTSNSSEYPKGFKLQDMNWTDFAECPVKAHTDHPAVLSFPTENGVETKPGAAYYMFFTEANALIVSISLLYSEQLPPSYDDDPFNENPDDGGQEEPVVDELPATVELNVDFTQGWPFTTGIKAESEQTTDLGDTYKFAYSYMYEGVEHVKEFSFGFKGATTNGGYNAYSYMTDDYRPGAAGSRMMIPAVENRWLKSVTMEVQNTSEKTFSLKTRTFEDLAACPVSAVSGTPATLSFPITVDGKTVNTTKGSGYYLYFSNANAQVSAIRLVYTLVEPE